MSIPTPGFDICLSLIAPLFPSLPCFSSTHIFFHFAIDFSNSVRSPLATSNPKLRWDFFAPPGKPLHSSVELMFLPSECWMHRVSLPLLQGPGNNPSVPSVVFHSFPELWMISDVLSVFDVFHLYYNYARWNKCTVVKGVSHQYVFIVG